MKDRLKAGHVLVRCNSCRARQRLFQVLGYPPAGWVSSCRNVARGVYDVPVDRLDQVLGIKGVRRAHWSDDLLRIRPVGRRGEMSNDRPDALPGSPFGGPPALSIMLQRCGAYAEERFGWQPPADLVHVHDEDLARSLWQRLLAVVRQPVHVVEYDGQRVVQILGVARLRRNDAGQISVRLWRDDHGPLAWAAVPPSEIVLQALPAGWIWLEVIRRAAVHEIKQHCRHQAVRHGSWDVQRYSEALFAHFRRRLKRHADLRVMRRRVAVALSLDVDAVRLARRLIQLPIDRGLARLSYYNDARRHISALRVLDREVPAAVPLYAALADRLDLASCSEPAAVLRQYLLQQGLKPSVWRLVAHASRRLWLPVRHFYAGGDAGVAMLDYLRVLQALGIDREPPAWLAWCVLSQVANPEFRHPLHYPVMQHYLPSMGHATRTYLALPDRAGARLELAAIARWISAVAPVLDKPQRRSGWRWLVRSAEDWGRESATASSSVRWPVPLEEHVSGGMVCLLIDSAQGLRQEGYAMHHCVAGFTRACLAGKALVASVRVTCPLLPYQCFG